MWRCADCDVLYSSGGRCTLCKGELEDVSPTPPTSDIRIKNCDGAIRHYKDLAWIAHQDLLDAGYRYLENFVVVLVHGRYYELQAHVGRETDIFPGGAWWIEEIDPTAFDTWLEAVNPDDFANYKETTE